MLGNKPCRQQAVKWALIFFAALLLTLLFFTHPTFASWVDPNSSIYHGEMGADKQSSVLETLGAIYRKIKGIASDMLGSLFADMIRNIGDSLYYLLALAGIDINAVVFGRVGGAAFMNDGISLFTFELVAGNPYGIVASYMYGAVRMAFVLILICLIAAKLATYLYSNGGARQRAQLKEAMSTSVILLLSVVLMPYLLGVAIYIRDAILYVEMVSGGQLVEAVSESLYPGFMDAIAGTTLIGKSSDIFYSFFGSTGEYSIITMFREAAGGNLLNSLMYVGAVAVTVYFAFSYISAAMSMVVLFIYFPMVGVVSTVDRSVPKNWIKQVLGILAIPIIDSTLIIIPIFFGLLGRSQSMSGYTIVQFILCCCIIPARGCVRMWLGLGGSSGMELAGIGALLGVMQLGKAITGAAIGLSQGHLEGKRSAESDELKAAMFTDMQKAQKNSGMDIASKLEDDVNGLFGISPEEMGDKEENQAQGFDGNSPFDAAYQYSGGREHQEEKRKPGAAPGQFQFGRKTEGGQDRSREASPGMGQPMQSDTGGPEAQTPADIVKGKINELDNRKAVLTDSMKQNDVRLAKINRELALLDEDSAYLKAERDEAKRNGSAGEGQAAELERRISENDIARKCLSAEATNLRGDNAIKAGQISRLDTASKMAKDALVSIRAGSGSTMSPGEQAVLDSYATIDNFETPDFRGISPEKKAELYRNRAKVTRGRTYTRAVLGAGSIAAGTVAAAGVTMFASPAAKMYAGATAINVGASFAELASEAITDRREHTVRPDAANEDARKIVSDGVGSPPQNVTRVLPGASTPTHVQRIIQKEEGSQLFLMDKERTINTQYEVGRTIVSHEAKGTYTKQQADQAYGDTDTGWIPGGQASDERIWQQVVTSSKGQKQVTTEVRRALTAASSNVRVLKRTLDAEPGRSAKEKNEEIISNAMNVFTSEFSYNLVNSGAILDDMLYSGFDPEAYQGFLKRKIRAQAKGILEEKLKSLGLLY